MASINIRLKDEEKELIEQVANLHDKSVTTYIRDTVMEAIEDEYDYQVAVKAHEEWVKDGKKSYPIEDLLDEYDV